MPNTLIHIAIQAPASRLISSKIELPWILTATIIPDIPWILQRILFKLQVGDPYQMRLYCTAQASFACSLLLCLVFSQFHPRRLHLFLLLAANSLVHLLLDASQIKWGNGVHLLAPFNWDVTNFSLIWPEHPAGYLAATVGLTYILFMLPAIHRDGLLVKHCSFLVLSGALLSYFLIPFLFMQPLEISNSSHIHTLRHIEGRTGKPIELDRAVFDGQRRVIHMFNQEEIGLTGKLPQQSGLTSIKGEFESPRTIRVNQYHSHSGYRNIASYIGLALIAIIWIYLLLQHTFQSQQYKEKP